MRKFFVLVFILIAPALLAQTPVISGGTSGGTPVIGGGGSGGGGTGPVISVSGFGEWGGFVYRPPSLAAQPPGAAANGIACMSMSLPFSTTVNKAALSIQVGAAGTADVGIYSSAGNLIANTGGFDTTTANVRSVNMTPAPTLAAGVYLHCSCASNRTATFQSAAATTANNWGIENQAGSNMTTAANACTNGVLPATLGTLTATSTLYTIGTFYYF